MREEVARCLCWHASTDHLKSAVCNTCNAHHEPPGGCELWEQFLGEADAAIAVVRRHNLLTPRKLKRR